MIFSISSLQHSRHYRLAIAFFFLSLLPVSASATLPDSHSLRERFGTDSTAADFIFVVNTSSGLSDAGVFAELRTQMPQLLEALSPRDNFILIGFNEKSTAIVSACPAGENKRACQSAIFRMRDPRGASGSLREGLGAALGALNRSGHAPLQFLFLVLDGKTVADRQAASTPDSLSWEALSTLHAEWQGRSIGEIYGLVVGDPSELQITRMVFPEIRFVETSVVSVRGFFERWRAELSMRKLRLQLSNEMAGNVLSVQPMGRLKFTDRQKAAELTVRVRSRLRKLSLTLPYAGDWSVFPDWLNVTPRYGDFPITLAPGQSRDLVVTVSREASESFWGCWHWRTRDKHLASISFAPAVSIAELASIRALGVDPPSPYMNKLAVEVIRQHGQPAFVLWIAIGILGLMIMSATIARVYDVTGADFAVSFLKMRWNKISRRVGKYIPQKLTLSEDVKLSLKWVFATSFILTLAFIITTIAILLLAENLVGSIALAVVGLMLLLFWAAIVKRQLRDLSANEEASDVMMRETPHGLEMPSLMKPTFDPVAEE
jgi:hypothetical protein